MIFSSVPDARIIDIDDLDYTQCRQCLEEYFNAAHDVPNCLNCGFHVINRRNKKLFIKYVDKMKYVEKLVHNYRIEIKPNSYTSLDANTKDNILQKYPYLLSFLYTSGYRNNVSHKYFINKFLNKPQKIHNENDKLWDEFLTK